MARVLLGVTGSVAAIKTPALFEELGQAGHSVRVVATQAALYFFDSSPLGNALYCDADEWPGERYQRGDPVLHIELRRWADLLLIAPLDANTLAKLAAGLADNCLTCIYRAWDPARPIVVAPAMNTLMWEHPLTARHLNALTFDGLPLPRIVGPITKQLACGDVGIGAMAEPAEIVRAVQEVLERFPVTTRP
ncbi:MAG: phosphopantothenoylcysteine decarboxylase [Planctomycetia bacterium]|nr:phosphopantothenoylcysteine decarboxylase [Planctomycetia bacterium]